MDAAGVARAATGMAEAAGSRMVRSISRAEVGVLDELVASWPKLDQLDVARTMLAHPQVGNSPLVRGPLATLRSVLTGASSENVAHATLLKDAQVKIAQEIDRIDGLIPSGGLDGHPDYAVVGSIKQTLDVLDRFGALVPSLAR
ncbi:MAG: hypothetical protein KDC46_04605 [Thermoleophilia bacterium]|nr:hypothetical protein [Thermoleophilia bacterium]